MKKKMNHGGHGEHGGDTPETDALAEAINKAEDVIADFFGISLRDDDLIKEAKELLSKFDKEGAK